MTRLDKEIMQLRKKRLAIQAEININNSIIKTYDELAEWLDFYYDLMQIYADQNNIVEFLSARNSLHYIISISKELRDEE